MASTISKKFNDGMSKQFNEILSRNYHLASMEDKIAKDWIIELQQQVTILRDEKCRILRAAGNSAFNPIHY